MSDLIEQQKLSTSLAAFAALSEPDRRELRRWMLKARVVGIDDVEDLSARPWCRRHGAVIGLYASRDDHARWLAVELDGFWAVVSFADGGVSEPLASLAAALEKIYRATEASGCN